MPFLGLVAASALFLAAILVVGRFPLRAVILVPLAFAAAEMLVLSLLFDVLVEREIVGRIAWSFLGY
jgi:hypothetical protein